MVHYDYLENDFNYTIRKNVYRILSQLRVDKELEFKNKIFIKIINIFERSMNKENISEIETNEIR